MKLRRLSVNQFKRFTGPTRLGEICDGLNLVIGPNEYGKSTLLDALRAVLFERYNSRAKPILALQNDRSGAAPVVELVFEVNGAEYTLTKRFVNSPYARLQCPDGTLLEADAAERELRSLLGFAQSGNRGADSETLGMWGVLWVQQGQSFGRLILPGSALESLSAGLESEVGTVLGGRRGRELPQIVEQLLRELISEKRQQPRGEYKSLLDQIEDQEKRLGEQQQLQRTMAETLEQLVMAETRLERLDDGNQDRIDQDELERARVQLSDVMRSEAELEAAQSELQYRKGQLHHAQRANFERASHRSELADAQGQLSQERKHLEELQQQEHESSALLEELRQAVDTAEAAAEAAEQSEARCRLNLDQVSRSMELSDLLQRQSNVATVQQRLIETRRKADQINVTDESLLRIREAAQALDQAKAQLSVVTTRIGFNIPSDRLAGIEVDGSQLKDPPGTIEAVEQVVITIPERGQIMVDPAIADRHELLQRERAAQSGLRAALEESGAQSVAEAEILRDQRRDHEADSTAAQGELERLLPPGGTLVLQSRIEELRQSQLSVPSEWQIGEPPDRDLVEKELRNAVTDLQKARERHRIARAAFEERGSSIAELTAEVLKAQSSVEFQTELVERRQEKLQSDSEAAPDNQLTAAVTSAAYAVCEQQELVSKREAEWSEATRQQLEARIHRLETAIRQRANLRADLGADIARLQERVESHDSAGIGETIEKTQHRLDQAKQQRDRFEREIEVLELLGTTLRSAESEAKERYLAPVLNRVRPYLQMLFPNAEITMNEDLKIIGMSRVTGYEESFDRLSMGTQEQIAVLVRLAFAEMLIDQGAPAAVVLDDALVFSDDKRMQLMFDILSHAARRVQILVFTCREQLFEGLGAHQLQLTSADPESLRSA